MINLFFLLFIYNWATCSNFNRILCFNCVILPSSVYNLHSIHLQYFPWTAPGFLFVVVRSTFSIYKLRKHLNRACNIIRQIVTTTLFGFSIGWPSIDFRYTKIIQLIWYLYSFRKSVMRFKCEQCSIYFVWFESCALLVTDAYAIKVFVIVFLLLAMLAFIVIRWRNNTERNVFFLGISSDIFAKYSKSLQSQQRIFYSITE